MSTERWFEKLTASAPVEKTAEDRRDSRNAAISGGVGLGTGAALATSKPQELAQRGAVGAFRSIEGDPLTEEDIARISKERGVDIRRGKKSTAKKSRVELGPSASKQTLEHELGHLKDKGRIDHSKLEGLSRTGAKLRNEAVANINAVRAGGLTQVPHAASAMSTYVAGAARRHPLIAAGLAAPVAAAGTYGALQKTSFQQELEKLAGYRTNEVLAALKEVATKPTTREHLKAWSRHAALNAGQAEAQIRQAVKGVDYKGRPASRRKEGKDALQSAIFAALPPTHHTPQSMKEMIPASHGAWYRRGKGGPDPLEKKAGDDRKKTRREMRKALRRFSREKGLDPNKAMLVAGGAAYLHGFRDDVNDIDFFHPDLKGFVNEQQGKFEMDGGPARDLPPEAKEWQRIGGMKVQTPKAMLSFYQRLNRPKDQAKIKFLSGHLEKEAAYKEGKKSTFTHDKVRYSVDKAIATAKALPVQTMKVKDLTWIFKYSKPQKGRVRKADPSVPILVASWDHKKVVVDGLHRLRAAQDIGQKEISVRYLSPSVLKQIEKTAGSKLRSAAKVVLVDPSNGHYPAQYALELTLPSGAKEWIGSALVDEGKSPTISAIHLDREWHGYGLGKKLYGDLIKRYRTLGSDGQVSLEARRVWEGMPSRGYRVKRNPSAKIAPDGTAYTTSSSGVYTTTWPGLKKTAEEGGHWRRLKAGQKGHGRGGELQVGRTWVSKNRMRVGMKALPHQADFSKAVKHQIGGKSGGGIIAAHGTGTGKTFGSINAFEELKGEGKARRALVIAPAGLRQNFLSKGINKFTTSKGVILAKPSQVSPDTEYVVVSYAAFRQNPEAWIKQVNPDMIIADEVHRAGNPNGQTFKALRYARSHVPRFMGLTASISQNNPSDIVPLLDIAQAGGQPIKSKRTFRKHHIKKMPSQQRGIFGGRTFQKKLVDHPRLTKGVGSSVHYVEDLDASSKPIKDAETVEVRMSREQGKKYHLAMKGLDPSLQRKIRLGEAMGGKERANAFTRLLRARQASNSLHLSDSSISLEESATRTPKMRKVLDDVSSHIKDTPDAQVIMYTNYVRGGVDVLSAGLKAKGIPFGVFAGKGNMGITEASRQKAVVDYQAGKNKVILITGAGAEGLSLGNTTMVQLVDGHYNPERMAQAEARGIRAGGLSHRKLENRRVKVKRYVSTLPKTFWQSVTFKQKDKSVGQWVYSTAGSKQDLNKELRKVLATRTEHERKKRESRMYRTFKGSP